MDDIIDAQDELRSDGGAKPENHDDTDTHTQAETLTDIVESTLEGQKQRQERHNAEVEEKQARAAEETQKVVEAYESLRDRAPEIEDWALDAEVEASELVSGLTHEADKGIAEYVDSQSNAVDNLSSHISRFVNIIEDATTEIEERNDRLDELENERTEAKKGVATQIEEMDEDEFARSPREFDQSERDSVNDKYDRRRDEVEEEIAELHDQKRTYQNRKQDKTGERRVRREETAEVYGKFSEEAQSTVSDNVDTLTDSLRTLRRLKMHEEKHQELSVESNDIKATLEQGQEEQEEAREEAAAAYIHSALTATAEIRDTVRDHRRVVDGISSRLNLDPKDLSEEYSQLVSHEYMDDSEDDIEALRNRVLDAAEGLSGISYDGDRELRAIADQIQEEYGN